MFSSLCANAGTSVTSLGHVPRSHVSGLEQRTCCPPHLAGSCPEKGGGAWADPTDGECSCFRAQPCLGIV